MSALDLDIEKWIVPREWPGERCFIIGGGESVKAQRAIIPKLQGRIIAIKQSVKLRPDADVMLVSGRDDPITCREFFPIFRGKYIVARKNYPGFPPGVKATARTKIHDRLSTDPRYLAGLDAGASAINLAYLFGATEIVLLGMDMRGGRWLNGEIPHNLPFPPQQHFDRHIACLNRMAVDLADAGIAVYNASPNSALKCFEKRPLESFL